MDGQANTAAQTLIRISDFNSCETKICVEGISAKNHYAKPQNTAPYGDSKTAVSSAARRKPALPNWRSAIFEESVS